MITKAMTAKQNIFAAGLLCLSLSAIGCAGSDIMVSERGLRAGAVQAPALTVSIATGSPEGTYYQIAQDIRELAEKEGILFQVIQTTGSCDNINLLGAGKVDLAILQLDVLKFVTEVFSREAGINVLDEAKLVLNLYLEEIHVVSNNPSIRSLEHLQGKRVGVGPEESGSALTAEVLLAGFGVAR